MKKQLVFIDDSGDPGFKEGASSSTFVMAGAIFIDSETATLVNNAITQYRQELGWKDEHEFKFRKAPKKVKTHFLQLVSRFDFSIYAVYLNKRKYPNVFKFSDDKKLYNWATKELLEIMPLHNAVVKMDGKYGKKYKLRVKSYIRKELGDKNKINNFDTQDSAHDNLIQLADMIVGSINRYLQNEKTDSGDYIQIIDNKIANIKQLDLRKT